MAKHLFLFDGNSIAHANHNGAVLTVGGPRGFQTQAIFGFLKSTKAILAAHPGDKDLMVLWDGKAQWRLDIYPEYKGNRKPKDAEAKARDAARKAQMPFLEKALELLGVKQVRSPLLEADDLAKHIVAAVLRANDLKPPMERTHITLVSGDQDWIQLVCEDVSWFDPIRDRRVDHADFFEKTGYFDTAAFVQGKALVGDTSDNIPGIDGVGDDTAMKFLAQWRNVERFLAGVDDGTVTPKARKSKTAKTLHPEQILASPEGRALVARNLKLMDMTFCRKPEPGEMVIKAAPGRRDAFVALCERLMFASILREQAMFLKHFPNCK